LLTTRPPSPAYSPCRLQRRADRPAPLDDLPRPSPAESRLIDAGNAFTFSLFLEATRALPPDSNAFLSPLNASLALGMAMNGANGETFEAMRATLGFGAAPMAEINAGYRNLIALLTTLDPATSVTVAHSVWSDAGFPILPSFVQAAKTWFEAEARAVPFADPATLGVINGWVSDKTRGRIPKLLSGINPEVALINAIHFKGSGGTPSTRREPAPPPSAAPTASCVPWRR
jgi:serpin B